MNAARCTLVLVACVFLIACGDPRSKWSVLIGEQGTAGDNSTSRYSVMVDSKASFDKWLRCEMASDNMGKEQMAMTGAAHLIPNGTRLLVLDIGNVSITPVVIPVSRVRILDGEFAGMAGWMAAKSVLRR